jgi:glucosamine-6-phosphate deaminase
MQVQVFADKHEMARNAARQGAAAIRNAIEMRGEANIIVATGASQFEVLTELSHTPDIDWSTVRGFHLDEYVGMPITHPASFRLYLWKRFISQLPLPMKEFYFIDGCADLQAECLRVGNALQSNEIDIAFVGIGENAHLAFNDPPADFMTDEPLIVVNLDEACRRQQFGEGWFKSLEEVPRQAVSMSIRQIMKSRTVVCTVPDARKAKAVKDSVEGAVSALTPASILQEHLDASIYLDRASASLLESSLIESAAR